MRAEDIVREKKLVEELIQLLDEENGWLASNRPGEPSPYVARRESLLAALARAADHRQKAPAAGREDPEVEQAMRELANTVEALRISNERNLRMVRAQLSGLAQLLQGQGGSPVYGPAPQQGQSLGRG